MAGACGAAEARLLELAQQQLCIERQLRGMLEEEATHAQERYEHEQVYQKHCHEEVGTVRARAQHGGAALQGHGGSHVRPTAAAAPPGGGSAQLAQRRARPLSTIRAAQ